MELNRDISSRYRKTQDTRAQKSTSIPVNVADTPVVKKPGKKRRKLNKKIIIGIVAILALIGSFFGGVQYQKAVFEGQEEKDTASHQNTNRQRTNTGKVTAITQSSVTIKDRTNHEFTYAITEATRIRDRGVSVTADDIKVNNNVTIYVDADNSKHASVIIIVAVRGVSERGSNLPAQQQQ